MWVSENQLKELREKINDLRVTKHDIQNKKNKGELPPTYNYDEKMFELNSEIIQKVYQHAEMDWTFDLQNAHKSSKNIFSKKHDEKKYADRANNNKIAKENINKMLSNPLVNGSISSIYEDTKEVRTIQSLKGNINRDPNRKNDSELQAIFKTTEKVINEYDKLIGKIDSDLNNVIDYQDKMVERKSVSEGFNGREYSDFIDSLNKRVSNNKSNRFVSQSYNVYSEAEKAYKNMDSEKIAKERAQRASEEQSRIIMANMNSLFNLDVIEALENQLSKLQLDIPEQVHSYSGYKVDYTSLIETVKTVEKELSEMKKQIKEKLEKKGYDKVVEDIKSKDNNESVINAISNIYDKININIDPNERTKLINDIENILINNNIPKDEWDMIKMKARSHSHDKEMDKIREKQEKEEKKEIRENRDIAIMNRDLISETELNSIINEAKAAANARFKVDYQLKSGDAYDLNEKQRNEFIEKYVNERVQGIVGTRYDNQQRDKITEEKAALDYTQTIQQEKISEPLLALAAEMLKADGRIEDDNLTHLKPTQIKEVVDFAKNLKKYDELGDMALAEMMARDLKGDNVTKEDIITQYNMNNMHNTLNKLRTISDMELQEELNNSSEKPMQR